MSETEVCRFQIQLTVKELWRFGVYHTNRGIMGFVNLFISVGALILLCVNWNTSTLSYKLGLFLCVMVFLVWQPGILYRKSYIQAKTPAIAQPMELTFYEYGFHVTQGDRGGEVAWNQITRADRAAGMILLYVDKRHAYLIPADVMNGQEQALTRLLKDHLPRERRHRI